jgi:branched-chain amino acid transport system permease protein
MTTLAENLYLLIAAYGLALPVSYAGLPVLGQGAFVAVGAFGTFQLAAHGVPLLVAVAAAVGIAAVAGYLLGFAATRLAGASLALGTWALAWLAYLALVDFPDLSGGSAGILRESPARLVSPSLGLTVTLHPWVHVIVGAVLACAIALVLLRARSGPWALDWAALRTGPDLADSLGVPVQRRRRALLGSAAALGALGGAGGALLHGVIAPPDYSPLLSLQLFVAVLVGGTAMWWGPPLGIGLLAVLPWTADRLAEIADIEPLRARAVLTALLLVAVLAARRPVAQVLAGLRGGRRSVAADPDVGPRSPATAQPAPRPDASPQRVVAMTGVVVEYGAVRALDSVDLELRAGEVHALIGPNGSGKSTVLRVLSGVTRPLAGSVTVAARPAPGPGNAARRVGAGVARTLQRTATLGALPARVQVAVGARARDVDRLAGLRHLLRTPSSVAAEQRRREATDAALRAVGLSERSDVTASRLDSAGQRLLQIARVVATGAPALLLDEPAAGMSRQQRDELVAVLRGLAEAQHGVLLVEHDIALVGRVADRVTVLNAGSVLATGNVDDVRRDPAVRAAYLGEVPSSAPRRAKERRPQ